MIPYSTPDSSWTPERRAALFLGMGYSAGRVAELFEISPRLAHALKVGEVQA